MMVAVSYHYDDIMRELLRHREMFCIGKEYWIS
jgi:hypothetical protein